MRSEVQEFAAFAGAIACLMFIAGIALGTILVPNHEIRLVGYNCEKASGPLYAQEEDHFPPCEVIEAWK